MKYLGILSLVLILFSFTNTNQQTEPTTRYFVQFKINTISTFDEEVNINNFMQGLDGIQASRADFYSSTYFCYLNPGYNYTQSQFEGWFETLGYSIQCFHKGIDNIDESLSIETLKNCGNE